jgi:hypothetical protein
MRRNNYPLRLQRTLMEEARKAAASEGVSLNQLINVAVAEKVSALRTEIYLHERIRRAYQEEQLRLLDRALMEDRSLEGDEPLNRGLEGFGNKPEPEVQPAPHQIRNAREKPAKRSDGQLPNLASSRSD